MYTFPMIVVQKVLNLSIVWRLKTKQKQYTLKSELCPTYAQVIEIIEKLLLTNFLRITIKWVEAIMFSIFDIFRVENEGRNA